MGNVIWAPLRRSSTCTLPANSPEAKPSLRRCRATCNTKSKPRPSPPHRPAFTSPCQCSLVHSRDITGTWGAGSLKCSFQTFLWRHRVWMAPGQGACFAMAVSRSDSLDSVSLSLSQRSEDKLIFATFTWDKIPRCLQSKQISAVQSCQKQWLASASQRTVPDISEEMQIDLSVKLLPNAFNSKLSPSSVKYNQPLDIPNRDLSLKLNHNFPMTLGLIQEIKLYRRWRSLQYLPHVCVTHSHDAEDNNLTSSIRRYWSVFFIQLCSFPFTNAGSLTEIRISILGSHLQFWVLL